MNKYKSKQKIELLSDIEEKEKQEKPKRILHSLFLFTLIYLFLGFLLCLFPDCHQWEKRIFYYKTASYQRKRNRNRFNDA